jgi:uncharacterized membrane protein/uncharacterized protein (UPF0548 family)
MQTFTVGEPFTRDRLEEALVETSLLPPSVTVPPRELTLEKGYSQVRSQSVIACEEPGPPQRDGAFTRACAFIAAFEHSDPRIVLAHFDARAPLLHRPVLLELQSLGMHFLAPVRVAELRRQQDSTHTTFGFQLQTLRGHIERGREWFLVEKQHATGEVRFRIEAAWQPGQFPTWWAHLGFHVLGRRYQRAWHRLAHQRLRRLLSRGSQQPARDGMVHHQRVLSDEPVQFIAQRGRRPGGRTLEQEHEHFPRDVALLALEIGALAAVRSLAAPATLAGCFGRLPRLPGLPRPARALTVGLAALALAEAAADKTPLLPARTDALPLAGRALFGLLCGAAPFTGRARWQAALVAGAAAIVGTVAITRLRRRLACAWVGNVAAGFGEDALALGLARGIARRLEHLAPIRGTQVPGLAIEDAVALHRAAPVA